MDRNCMALSAAIVMAAVAGCDDKKAAPPKSTAPTTTGGGHAGHDHHDGHAIELGSDNVSGFEVKASRDEGKIEAGKDAAINADIAPKAGNTNKAVAVRFWIGTQDAKGSVKAKAEIEDAAKHPNGWHAHAEVPSPLPAGSKLWIEIEDDKGTKGTVSFDLKM